MIVLFDIRTGTYTASYCNMVGYGESRPKAICALLSLMADKSVSLVHEVLDI